MFPGILAIAIPVFVGTALEKLLSSIFSVISKKLKKEV